MNKLIIAAAVSGITLGGAGIGLVNAAPSGSGTAASTPANSIARYTMREERLNAVAEVLNTTPSQLEDTLKTETMQQAIKNAGFTQATFEQKVKAQLQSDLEAKGYSQTQITNAMSHPRMHGMRHRDADDSTSTNS